MTFIQRIQPGGACGHAHGNCCVIDCITTEPILREDGSVIHEGGATVWWSHMDSGICPEHRLNPDHPAEDHRNGTPLPVTATEPCEDCKVHPAAQGHFGL
jgi:hypothetical protein